MRKSTLFIVICLTLIILTGCQMGSKIKDPLNWPVDDFTFTDQNGNSLSLSNLRGQVWLADFIFTNCKTVCIPMTSNMVKLQQQLKEADLDVSIVSFSVDPEHDTPEVLTEYGKQFNVDFSNWYFLTGYAQEEIAKIAKENFKTFVEDDPNTDQVIHGTYFYLINQNGVIVQLYDGVEPPYEDIMNDIKSLLK